MKTPTRSSTKTASANSLESSRAGQRWISRIRDLSTLVRQGVLRPMRPDKLLRIFLAWRRWGVTLPLGYAVGAVRCPDRPALIDERGALSFAEVDQRTSRLANGLRRQGVTSADRVGVLCRNHHGIVETMLACAKIGADVVLLNTGLAADQLSAVFAEQRVKLLVCDEEFTSRVEDVTVVLAWTEGTTQNLTLEHLVASSRATRQPRRPGHSRMIVLTSGTTGAPKGARRPHPPGLSPAATMMSRLPLHSGERILVSAPMFHTWGLAAVQLGTLLGATLVLRRKFEPREALAALGRHRCTAMFAAPIMVQRILDLPSDVRTTFDTRSLRIVAVSGSALPSELANRFQRTFGGVLYNVYGSTEASWISIATPRDLRQAPTTAGKPPRGTRLRILDDAGKPVPTGDTGRVFVGNNMLFDGYTSDTGLEVRDGMMCTGDLGRIDTAGRLYVVGREDDMIVSGGENVYPRETEEALRSLTQVADAAVIGVDDTEYGQRLAAFVVPRAGATLDSDSVRESVRSTLPAFAVPRDVVLLDELPRNATDKVISRDLHHLLDNDT